MAALRRFFLRLWNAIAPGRAERDLARQVASHLALLEDEFRQQGLSDADASVAARRALGGAEQAKDRHRDARSFVWLDDLRRDLSYAARTLLRAPGFTLVAVLTLALGIGASTAIFSVVDHVLLRSLPLPDAGRLVRLYESNPTAQRPRQDGSPANVADWRRATKTLDLLTEIGGTRVTMTGAAEPESVIAMQVGPEYFPLTGITLTRGRPFDPSEYQSIANAALGPIAAREPVTGEASVIISHALWHRQFGGDPHVIGRRVDLNGIRTVVTGVMPADNVFDKSPWGVAECWVPLVESRMLVQRRFRQFTVIGRLAPGVSIEAAQHELTAVAAGLETDHPADNKGWGIDVVPLRDSMTGDARATLLILFGGVGCVLLIACANIANLQLMRAAGRSREVAIRMAIGAGRSRLIRQWLTESVLLSVIGGLAGFVLTIWAVPALVAYAPPDLPRLDEIAVDARVFGFSLGISLLTGLLCGIAPALGARRVTVAALRSAGAVAAGSRRRWLRPTLVVVQVGLAIVLLVGAGLMARTVMAVYSLELGFDPHHVLTFGVDMRGPQYRGLDAMRGFSRDLTAALQQVPGVEAAGVGGVPLVGGLKDEFLVEHREQPVGSAMDVPSPGYFRGLGIRLASGRFFTDQDDERAQLVAIVTRSFAHQAWGDDNVVGRRVRLDYTPETWLTVVGVVNDLRVSGLEADAPPLVFIPYLQSRVASMSNYVVRWGPGSNARGPGSLDPGNDPERAIALVRDAVRRIDPTLALTRIATMDQRVARAVAPRQFNLWLIGLFSLLALVLAAGGIYGLISEAVGNRTSEIGVRMALGASRLQIVRLVVGGSLLVTAIGMTVGLAGAAAASQSLGSMLFGVTPLDPLTLATVPLTFAAVAFLAALAPARRATKVDPVKALRGE